MYTHVVYHIYSFQIFTVFIKLPHSREGNKDFFFLTLQEYTPKAKNVMSKKWESGCFKIFLHYVLPRLSSMTPPFHIRKKNRWTFI